MKRPALTGRFSFATEKGTKPEKESQKKDRHQKKEIVNSSRFFLVLGGKALITSNWTTGPAGPFEMINADILALTNYQFFNVSVFHLNTGSSFVPTLKTGSRASLDLLSP